MAKKEERWYHLDRFDRFATEELNIWRLIVRFVFDDLVHRRQSMGDWIEIDGL